MVGQRDIEQSAGPQADTVGCYRGNCNPARNPSAHRNYPRGGINMKLNQRGIAELLVAVYILGGLLALLFIPNPVSSSLGMGIKPNKTVYTEKVALIRDNNGNPIGTKTTVSDQDIQQHVTFLEWLRSLPVLVIILMGLGIVFPPVVLWLHNAWSTLKTDTQKIVLSVDKGLAILKAKDPALHEAVINEMADTQKQPSSAEVVVNKAQVGKL